MRLCFLAFPLPPCGQSDPYSGLAGGSQLKDQDENAPNSALVMSYEKCMLGADPLRPVSCGAVHLASFLRPLFPSPPATHSRLHPQGRTPSPWSERTRAKSRQRWSGGGCRSKTAGAPTRFDGPSSLFELAPHDDGACRGTRCQAQRRHVRGRVAAALSCRPREERHGGAADSVGDAAGSPHNNRSGNARPYCINTYNQLQPPGYVVID